MSSFKKILVILDPTKDKQPALQKGIYLAKQFSAEITLFLVAYNRSIVSNLFFDSEQLESAKKGFINTHKRWVNSYLEQAKEEGVLADTDIIWGKPIYEVINQKVDEGGYDLVIKSTHNHPMVNRIFFTPNDWQLLKSCSKPIIMAKAETADGYSNIMAGIDPSNCHEHSKDLDPKILRTTNQISKDVKAQAHAVHCYDPLAYQLWSDIGIGMGTGMGPSDFTMGQDNYDQYIKQLQNTNSTNFNDAIASADFPKEHLYLEEGYPEQVLPVLVKSNNIDLMVMGTSYHSGLIGSTIEKILDEIECDIMAVKV